MISKKLVFGALGVCFLFLCLYVFIVGRGRQEIAVKIESASLRSLYNKWVSEKRPSVFEPSDYLTSTATEYAIHNNVYYYNNTIVKSIISAKSDRFIERGFLIISEEGLIYWVSMNNSIKPILPKVKRKG